MAPLSPSSFCVLAVLAVLAILIAVIDAEIRVKLNEQRYKAQTGESTVPHSKRVDHTILDRQVKVMDSSSFEEIIIHHETVVDACQPLPRRVQEVVQATKQDPGNGRALLISMSAKCDLELQIQYVDQVQFDYLIFYSRADLEEEEDTFPVSLTRVKELRAGVGDAWTRVSVTFVKPRDARLLQKLHGNGIYTLTFVEDSNTNLESGAEGKRSRAKDSGEEEPRPARKAATSNSYEQEAWWNSWNPFDLAQGTLARLVWDLFLSIVVLPLAAALVFAGCAILLLGAMVVLNCVSAVCEPTSEWWMRETPAPPARLLSPRLLVDRFGNEMAEPNSILRLRPHAHALNQQRLVDLASQLALPDLNLLERHRAQLLEQIPNLLALERVLWDSHLAECNSCFICEEVFQEGESVPWLEHGCLQKQPLHSTCLELWWKETVATNCQIRCPVCRQDIKD